MFVLVLIENCLKYFFAVLAVQTVYNIILEL